jgi:hypothetical protein
MEQIGNVCTNEKKTKKKGSVAHLLNETLGFHQISKITVCINLSQHKMASVHKIIDNRYTNNFT